ncbi:hypothetical protein PV08_07429 [Exophiala spinifera]|uniref:PH domain-containing protein n=1 Tax=Exophiala spinifera TaxID=91928 RepID=A0A0D2B7I9_9EURO|nr:uncharacterized protein PV08_07429 [Exophiala spinifera]KIW14645.1 hypothetical protein PV08_07429 [Exophiala spinifera]
MNTDAGETTAQLQKFLRYRSVRKAASTDLELKATSPPPPVPNSLQSALTRLPSRYHRRPKPAAEDPLVPFPPQNVVQVSSATRDPVPAQHIPTSPPQNEAGHSHKPNGARRMVIGHGRKPLSNGEKLGAMATESKPGMRPTSPETVRRSLEIAREEARLTLEGDFGRLKALKQEEAQRRRDEREQRREAAKINARKESVGVVSPPDLGGPQHTRPTRQGAEEKQHPREAPKPKLRTMVIGGSDGVLQDRHHKRSSSAMQRQHTVRETHTRSSSTGKMCETRSTMPQAAVPQFDAPISAVNAGERKVKVKCKESIITLAVTPTTTCKEVLRSAALCLTEPIDARTAVLLESFSQLGLERPLRRYERIRDVMNSWDHDDQNYLFIMAQSECAAAGIDDADAPRQQPTGVCLQIYHSHRPGKWDKRWLKLREDGQITTSKHEHGLDSTKICHLSDFDLYTPTSKQLKKLNPPKKLCFALKSQEKSSMFLNGVNFVHFFSTKDKGVAAKWYTEVQSWRSWYLYNMVGEGVQSQPQAVRPPTGKSSKESLPPRSAGSFKPLLGVDSGRPSTETAARHDGVPHRRFSQSNGNRPLLDFGQDRPSLDGRPGSPRQSRNQSLPPSAYPRKLTIGSTGGSTSEESPFSGTGLIARSASRKSLGRNRPVGGGPGADGKPLVDLAPTSEFTDGSLLRKMEAIAVQQGKTGPKIFRQQGREISVSVGEGLD